MIDLKPILLGRINRIFQIRLKTPARASLQKLEIPSPKMCGTTGSQKVSRGPKQSGKSKVTIFFEGLVFVLACFVHLVDQRFG